MPNGGHSFLGIGFPHPLLVQDGEIQPAAEEEKIKQSIYVILNTRPGERLYRPLFGCAIWDYVFELPGETVMNLLSGEIIQSILRWEHRVTDVEAKIDTTQITQGRIFISVRYVVRATNRPDNLVFPFYLEEGQW